MKVWLSSLQLLLLASIALAHRGGLPFDDDELLGDLNDKATDEVDTSDEKTDDTGKEQVKIPWQIVEELVDAVKEFGSISYGPVAIYRDDLPSDYVAYWLAEFNSSQYVVVSSGPNTGDYLVSSQGPLPSPITQLDTTAEGYGKECVKYLMMTPGGEMMCRDKTGKTVATTIENLLLPGDNAGADPDFEFAHEYLDKHMTKLADQWKLRAAKVALKSIWDRKQVMTSTETNTMSDFTEHYVAPGGVIRVPVDEDTLSVKVKYQPEDKTQTAEEVLQIQKALCQMISSCDVDNDCSIDLSQKKSVLQMSYIELLISENIAAVFRGRQSVDFELRVEQASGPVNVKHYSLDTTKHRQKRSKEYKDYSSWSTKSIPHETYFPNYWQHTTNDDCYVGCGPVAWAMIFGYYDRRSHYMSRTYGTGSQGLYRCDSDGASGSDSCIAPSSSSSDVSRMKKYIEKIAKTLGTWCIFTNGATPASKMDHIESFFQARQSSGSPTVQQKDNFWDLFTKDKTASKTRAWIRSGWPVVVGTTEGSVFAWHYPVATKYRYRTYKYRKCASVLGVKVCGSWKSSTEYQMYTHQGWQSTQTKWRAMEVHYAAVASY